MKKEELLELMRAFEASSLSQMAFENDDCKISFKKPELDVAGPTRQEAPALPDPAPLAEAASSTTKVTAPLVGTFYRASSEGKKPFTAVGESVRKGQVLFILEAMKMYNEIKSPGDGTVTAIHAEDGELVEYGQVLVEIEGPHV